MNNSEKLTGSQIFLVISIVLVGGCISGILVGAMISVMQISIYFKELIEIMEQFKELV